MKKNNNIFIYYLLVFIIVLFDQVSKWLIRFNFTVGSSVVILKKILSFTYLQNTGVSFGLFKGYNWIFTIVLVFAFALFAYYFYKEKSYRLFYGIICSGILGNLIDRINLGYVVDFIDFHYWPVFNIADSAISIGIILLIIKSIKDDLKVNKKHIKSKKSKIH